MTRPDDQQTALLPPMKWNAWGDPAEAKPLSEGIRSLLRQAVGIEESTTAELEPDQVRLRPSALSPADREGLAAIVGSGYCGWTCCAARIPVCRMHPMRCSCPAVTRR